MKKTFKITNIVPFDLLRWGKVGFYEQLDLEYFRHFGRWIEILEADLKFISGGVSVKILTYREL